MMSKKIFEAIPKIMAEVGHIEKTRENKQQGSGYKFRGIDDVYAALQPVLHKHGVFFVPEVIENVREERASKSGGTLIYTILKVKYKFFADDGSSFEAVTTGEAMDSGDKSSNKAMSAALKYALLQIFCIPTEEEKDTEYHSPEVKPRDSRSVVPQPNTNAPGSTKSGQSVSEYPVPIELLKYEMRGGRYKGRLIKSINPKEMEDYIPVLVDMQSKLPAVGTDADMIRDAIKSARSYVEFNKSFDSFK